MQHAMNEQMPKAKPDSIEKLEARQARKAEILDVVTEVCRTQGGMAEIGEGYVVADTRIFEVRMR